MNGSKVMSDDEKVIPLSLVSLPAISWPRIVLLDPIFSSRSGARIVPRSVLPLIMTSVPVPRMLNKTSSAPTLPASRISDSEFTSKPSAMLKMKEASGPPLSLKPGAAVENEISGHVKNVFDISA